MKKTRLINVFRFFFVALLLISCNSQSRFYRSNAFYINDRASALLSASRYYIYSYSRSLAENFSVTEEYKDTKIDGTQIVVATHLGAPESIDTTALYNDWKIGTNDLGILLVLYFAEVSDDDYGREYLGITMEIGPKMATFIPMIRLNNMYENTFLDAYNDGLYSSDYDYALMSFYFAILDEVLVKVYNNTTFDSQDVLLDYESDQYNSFYNQLPSETYNFSMIPWWGYVLIIVVVLLVGGRGIFALIFSMGGPISKGGGGRSRGYKHTR